MARDKVKYEGEDAVIVRDARQGDEGYQDEVKGQVLIRFDDGSEKAVLSSKLQKDV